MATTTKRARMGRLGIAATAGLMALTALATAAVPAAARHGADDGGNGAQGVERERHGLCTGSSDWELELEKEHGRIEVKVDVDTRRIGRQWRVKVYHNGSLSTNVLRRTARDGDIDLNRTRTDRSGSDTFRFRAVDQVNGEVCTGSLSI
ncbi:MAG: hypothetical protein U0667_00530 [Chloroflexota bacterium]